MAYTLEYNFIDMDLEIEETVRILVFKCEFILECKNKIVKEQMINFLEYLDIELDKLDEISLSDILYREFKIE